MGTVNSEPVEREELFLRVLTAFFEAEEAGERPDRDQWLARYPELAADLEACFQDEDRVERLVEPLRSVLPSDRERAIRIDRNPQATCDFQAFPSQAPLDAGIGQPFGDYELLGEIARGGMGIVYRARQKSLNRLVALKMMLREGPLASHADVQRFRAEAEAAARMDHPHIVTIYEVGEVDERPYLCLTLVEGASLAQKLQAAPLPVEQAVSLLEILARAIHYAHQRGVVHRDLKPANVLLSADGTPMITDFGLAKWLGRPGVSLTQADQIVGTPCYMAPEQAAGQAGPSSDIYALGAILYETLTGRPPFRGATVFDTLELLRSEEPAPPRLLNPKIDPDLQTICLKCLEKDPRNRYESAETLAQDLSRFRQGEPIHARSYNLVARITRTLQRDSHRTSEFCTWSTMLLLLAGIVLASHLVTQALVWHTALQWLDWPVRGALFGLGLLVFWLSRRRSFLPASSTERQLWSVWIGYLAAYATGVLVCRLLVAGDIIARGGARPVQDDWWAELIRYPFSSILSCLAFFVMGGAYWGRYYLLGLAFLAGALLMPLWLDWAPLAFGLLWTVALVTTSLHLRSLSAASSTPDQPRADD